MFKKLFIVPALTIAFVLLTINYSQAQGSLSDKNSYTGVKSCGMCHKKDKDGSQLKIWEESKHAQAFKVLASPEAKKIAAAKGIANPQKDETCLKCHAIGYQAGALVDKKFSIEDGVQCESCHGAGSEYKSMKVMKNHTAAVSAGMRDFSKDGSIKDLCITCHNEKSPTFKGFNFEEKWKEIAHPIPKG